MMLHEFQLDIAPVLTGAGIVGLAVGFGAQTLVRDIISGFFLILEDQVRVGDVAAINGTGGLVEAINLRTIVLRDAEGTVHVFPNGAITTLANRSKDFSLLRDRPRHLLSRGPRSRGGGAARSWAPRCRPIRRYGPWILEPLEILGVDAFRDWSMRAEDADQDRAAEAVGRRPRVPEADPSALRGGRHRSAVSGDRAGHAPATEPRTERGRRRTAMSQ